MFQTRGSDRGRSAPETVSGMGCLRLESASGRSVTGGTFDRQISGAVAAVIAIACLLGGCDSEKKQLSGDPAQVQGESSQIPMERLSFLGLETEAPQSWLSREPASSMRLLQFDVEQEGVAEVIVYYFGMGQGGSAEANIQRWSAQFRDEQGKPVQPLVHTSSTSGELPVTWVELSGEYARGVGMGPVGEFRPDQTLLVAITETPHGNLYIQFHGDSARVLKHRPAFTRFVTGIRQSGESGS